MRGLAAHAFRSEGSLKTAGINTRAALLPETEYRLLFKYQSAPKAARTSTHHLFPQRRTP